MEGLKGQKGVAGNSDLEATEALRALAKGRHFETANRFAYRKI